MEYKIGFSKDIHRLVPLRKLILAGVIIPFSKGEMAHSDGDVVYHAVSESILGALALGDLGSHFPDSDQRYKDMDSSFIVKHVVSLMKEKGFVVNNIDVFILLEKPKIRDYIEKMRSNLSSLLEIDVDSISIKVGTNEGCGEVGKGEAVEATSIVLLKK